MSTQTNSDSAPKKRNKSDLVHLRSLPAVEPVTGTGRVAWIWPEIEASLNTGKKLREIWDAACADGFDIPYAQFRVYVSRIRSRRFTQRRSEPALMLPAEASSNPQRFQASASTDPFRNLREQREKKQSDGFRYDPFSIERQLID